MQRAEILICPAFNFTLAPLLQFSTFHLVHNSLQPLRSIDRSMTFRSPKSLLHTTNKIHQLFQVYYSFLQDLDFKK